MRLLVLTLLALAAWSSACSHTSAPSSLPLSPTAAPPPPALPPPAPPPPPSTPAGLVLFIDPDTGMSTTDLRDVDDQIIQISTADELIWASSGLRFAEFIAYDNVIAYHHRQDKFFQVRFGTSDGKRQAYVTWPDQRLLGAVPTLLDLWVDDRGDLKIADTNVPVPGN